MQKNEKVVANLGPSPTPMMELFCKKYLAANR